MLDILSLLLFRPSGAYRVSLTFTDASRHRLRLYRPSGPGCYTSLDASDALAFSTPAMRSLDASDALVSPSASKSQGKLQDSTAFLSRPLGGHATVHHFSRGDQKYSRA